MSDTPKDKDTVGFYARVRDGSAVRRMDGDTAVDEPITRPLRLGERLACQSMFGWEEAEVTEVGDTTARAESKGVIYPLRFATDDRGCWTCSMALDKRALARIALV